MKVFNQSVQVLFRESRELEINLKADKKDVRLLINFGPVHNLIKPIQSHVNKTDDIFITLGRWNYIIIFDLYNGYFQNHMSKDAIPWLSVQTPLGGLRVMSRSGQGLGGMVEEFDGLLAKVLKQELQDGICTKILCLRWWYQ